MQGQNEGEKGEESEEALGMSEYTSNLLSQGIRQGEPEHLNQRNNDSTTHNNLNTKAAPTYSPEISVGDQHDGSHPSVIEQVASGLNATTTEDSHRGNTAESPILGRPSRPRTSKPKVKFGCDNCEQRRIKCDERRPACTQCVRLGKTCPGYYPPPRVKLYERPDIAPRLAALAAEIPNIRVAGFITPSQTTSTPDGYSSGSPSGVWLAGTSSSGGGTQTDRTVPNDSSLSDIMWIQNATYTVANDLYAKIGADQLSDLKIKQISNSLPRLLRALARNIGYQYQTKLQYDIMVFINTVSKNIMEIFIARFYKISPEVESTELIDRWLASVDKSKFEEFRTKPLLETPRTVSREEFAQEPELVARDFEECKKVIIEDPAYVWMIARLRREILLDIPVHYISLHSRLFHITEDPIGQPNPHESGMKGPKSVKVTFTTRWDIMGFLRQQNYSTPHSEAIANAVTLTGTATNAQALSCRQYLEQTWPLTGTQVLKLIQNSLSTPRHRKTLYFDVPSPLMLAASITGDSSVTIMASGLPDFVVEVGEQLAWLGSALRPSRPSAGVSIYTAHASNPIKISSDDEPSNFKCTISYNGGSHQPVSQTWGGQCWYHLFSDPVIAQGFPILRRVERDTGLEMPLELMTALTGTKCLNTFNSNVFIKGFNTMLVPVKKSEDSVIWHLLHSEDPSKRISYLSSDSKSIGLTMRDLEQSRHVLGWCADAISIAGTTRSTYDIERSRLPKTHSRHMLEKVEISAGQFVTGTAAFTLGNREKPVHISRYGFLTKLQWISSKHVVLWDEGDKRGWLVSGTSALLHILRASLAHSKQKFRSAWLYTGGLKDPGDPLQSDAALQVLINEENRNLTLYMDKTEVYEDTVREGGATTNTSRRQTRHYRLEDKIEHIYDILEKLIDRQTDMERRSGLEISIRPRRQLEGWDFVDLVRDGDPIFPRATTLPTIGKGWVDFTRAIHAITLFGRGFGDLIQPRQANTSSCSRWSLVPKKNYYLATCVSTLRDIMEDEGDADSNPRRLCDNIIWHMRRTTFEPCPCTKGPKNGHHEPIQALFPLKFTSNLKKRAQVDLKDTGAVIFGHNTSLHWHWKDTGDPVKGDPPSEQGTGAHSFEDSGIGSSSSSLQPPSASDPSSTGSTGDSSPIPHPLISPTSPQEKIIEHPKRALELISSVKKRIRR